RARARRLDGLTARRPSNRSARASVRAFRSTRTAAATMGRWEALEVTMRSIPRGALVLVSTGLAAAVVVRLAAAAPPASANDLRRASGECQQGTKLLMAGDVAKAKERFAKARELVPSYPDALLGMGH